MTKRNYLSNNVLLYVPEAKILKTVVNTAPLTIYEVRTAKGTIAYKLHSREQLRPNGETLKEIWHLIGKELKRTGQLKDNSEWDREYHKQHAARYRENARKWYAKNKDAQNAKRRNRYANNRAMQQAMQNLSSHV